MKLILVRHVQTIKNKENLAQGLSDSDITEEGLKQIELTRDYLKKYKIDKAFCSPRGRAKKTAEGILKPHKIKVCSDERLSELDWGDWSDLDAHELMARWAKYYESEKKRGVRREDIRPPKGENAFDHMKKIKSFLKDKVLGKDYKTVLIVAHSGTNKVIIGLLRNVDPEEFYKIEQRNACINFLEIDKNGGLLSAQLNITDHLSDRN